MAFLGKEDLKDILCKENIILDDNDTCCYEKDNLKQASYELKLGKEVYLTDNKKQVKTILTDKKDVITINPGQFALLLTEETVNMPGNLLGFISIKASEKLKGLINVSGFHVDPGFKGKLLFSVYNASPSKIQLTKGSPYFLIWFSEIRTPLEKEDLYSSKNHQGQNTIESKYITPLINGEMASPHVLLKKINSQKDFINRLLWIAGIITTISIGITIKIWSDSDTFKKGYEMGLKEKSIKEEIKAKSNLYLNDSLSLSKIDSLINRKIKNEKLNNK
ncbi:deoxycytidine triphosphate deaminase [Myroides ceti]|uniref:Deoxycytidine triphosphate deaminase n=1 Tax=Paenimyroides ceti TaxID=395087 RepID=A0ABT8CQL8_9FLAO|nr:deoxycytidine triphosphate deaminase [Paenimyroides ceti]MDN3706291.1 deoxycytidine triphosphate deaminase [Paenimyroides ceti]